MSRTIAGVLAALVVVSGVAGVALSPAAGQVADEEGVDCSFPITVTDANGANVTVSDRPERIVTLAPSASQVLWELGAQDRVVGMPVNQYTSYLNGSEEKENVVGEEGQPQIETILDREPDLVLAPNIISEDAVEQLREANLTVYRFESASSIDDVVNKTRLTGRLVGSNETATEVSARTAATAEAYRTGTADEDRPSVYYALGDGNTAGPETFIGDVIDAAGGDNIASAANISGYDTISPEVVVEEDPDWIVVPEGAPVPTGPDINETTAIQENQIVRVDDNFVNQPGPRVTQPLETLATAFHPEAAANVTLDTSAMDAPVCAAEATTTTTDASDTPTTTAGSNAETTTEAGTDTPESDQTAGPTTERETTTAGPGFGIGAAIVAVLGAGIVARRR
ncbi:MAG: PGF-CTERM-anchored ABC transporter substrate-binding protein [Haloferacaceae archaeon]